MMENQHQAATLANGRAVDLAMIPTLLFVDFQQLILDAVSQGQRDCALFGVAAKSEKTTEIYVVLADDTRARLNVARTVVEGEQYPSLTLRCPQVHLFEREIAEQFGLTPTDHPWLKAVRYHAPWRGRDIWKNSSHETRLPGVGEFYRVEGEQVHEVAVGPVHAGIIEPGHFRFQCHGEEVFHLEIALGYQHRGIEKAMIGGPTKRSRHYMETLAGDTTIAHMTAHCQVLEALARCQKTARAQTLRGIALELERLANHVGDLGALAGDVSYLPAASFCGRLRGDFLNMTALLCGNRFGRGLIVPGGVGFGVDDERAEELLKRLEAAKKETYQAVNLLWDTPSVMARFEETGPLPMKIAVELGIVGPAARGSGLQRDARKNHPSGIFRFSQIPVSTCESGDVFARAFVRWLEIQKSIQFIDEQLRMIPAGDLRNPLGTLAANQIAIAINEGWRGEVCHVAITDEHGNFSRYKIIDPSFHNWNGLAHVMRDQQISDFPLCNKSFNLSYCGHDL